MLIRLYLWLFSKANYKDFL